MSWRREDLFPVWADLSARADAARAAYRAGGTEDEFKAALKALGFDWTGIQIELRQHRPSFMVAS